MSDDEERRDGVGFSITLEEPNLIEVDFRAEGKPKPRLVRGRPPKSAQVNYCGHQQSVVCHSERRVYCRDCEVELDPIETLLTLSRAGNEWEEMHRKRKTLREQVFKMKAVVKNAKARVASWRKKSRKAGMLVDGDEVFVMRDDGACEKGTYVGFEVPPKGSPGLAGVYAREGLATHRLRVVRRHVGLPGEGAVEHEDRWGCDHRWAPFGVAIIDHLQAQRRKREKG